jgi:hypothetical protein
MPGPEAARYRAEIKNGISQNETKCLILGSIQYLSAAGLNKLAAHELI